MSQPGLGSLGEPACRDRAHHRAKTPQRDQQPEPDRPGMEDCGERAVGNLRDAGAEHHHDPCGGDDTKDPIAEQEPVPGAHAPEFLGILRGPVLGEAGADRCHQADRDARTTPRWRRTRTRGLTSRDQHAAKNRAQRDAGVPARRDQAVGPRDVLRLLHQVRDGRGGRRPERDLGERRDEPHGYQRAGVADQREPEEGHGARQIGQDHHALAVELVAQDAAEGTEASRRPHESPATSGRARPRTRPSGRRRRPAGRCRRPRSQSRRWPGPGRGAGRRFWAGSSSRDDPSSPRSSA